MKMARRAPWQIISKKNEHTSTSATSLMREAGLDWKVELRDVYTPGKYDPLVIKDKYATVRVNDDETESTLSVVGGRYKVFQNEDIFSSLDFLVDSGEARYASAGELAGGKVVWVVMELPDSVKVAGDPHAGYLLARTSHDGSTAFELAPILSRLGCTNQIAASFSDSRKRNGVYSLRHTTNSNIQMSDIRNIINITYEDFNSYSQMASHLSSVLMGDEYFKNFVKKVYPLPSKIEFSSDELLSASEKRTRSAVYKNRENAWLVWKGETGTQENLYGTAFGALHAVIEVVDHFGRSDEKASSNILLSKDGKIKQRALQLLGV